MAGLHGTDAFCAISVGDPSAPLSLLPSLSLSAGPIAHHFAITEILGRIRWANYSERERARDTPSLAPLPSC